MVAAVRCRRRDHYSSVLRSGIAKGGLIVPEHEGILVAMLLRRDECCAARHNYVQHAIAV